MFGGEVMRLAVVFVEVVELPRMWLRNAFVPEPEEVPGQHVTRAGPPAILIDATIADHLEVLDLVRAGRIGMIEGVDQARSFQRQLLDAVNLTWELDSSQFVDGRRDVGDVMELTAE